VKKKTAKKGGRSFRSLGESRVLRTETGNGAKNKGDPGLLNGGEGGTSAWKAAPRKKEGAERNETAIESKGCPQEKRRILIRRRRPKGRCLRTERL